MQHHRLPPQLLETELSANPSIRRLQHLLDVVLRKEYEDLLKRRDEVYDKVSQQIQFQKLIKTDLKLVSDSDEGAEKEAKKSEAGEEAPVELMHDIGCKFYVKCQLLDTRVVHMNVGCGVIVAMTLREALVHSERAVKSYRARGEQLTKQALSAKYKQRLVTEAIMRLQDIQIEKDVARKRGSKNA